MTEQEKTGISQGYILMSPDLYPVVEVDKIKIAYRYHHIRHILNILSKASIFTAIPNFDQYNPFDSEDSAFLKKKYQELLDHSDTVFTNEQRHEFANKASQGYVDSLKMMIGKDNRVDDYIGKEGEHAEMYKMELADLIYEILSIPPETKIRFTFSPDSDQMCNIGMTTKGPMAHCRGSIDPNRVDYVAWLALNKTVDQWLKEPKRYPTFNKSDIGLVQVAPNLYDIFTTVKVLKTNSFFAAFLENVPSLRAPIKKEG